MLFKKIMISLRILLVWHFIIGKFNISAKESIFLTFFLQLNVQKYLYSGRCVKLK